MEEAVDLPDDKKKHAAGQVWKNKLCSKRSWCSIAFSSCCAAVIACIVAPSVFAAQRDASIYSGNLPAGDTRLLLNFSSFYCEGLILSADTNASLHLLTNVSRETRTIVQDQQTTNFTIGLNTSIFFLAFIQRQDANAILTVNACVNYELQNNTIINFITSDQTRSFLVKGICNGNVNETIFKYSSQERPCH